MRLVKNMIALALMAGAAFTVPTAATAQTYVPKGPIEAKYIAPGPWAVSELATTAVCDREGNKCRIFYPTNLGTNPITGAGSGFKHPMIAWANGTNGPTSQYVNLLRHWASWGFVVVASDDVGTETGETTTDATNYVIGLGNTAGSPFENKIDATKVGVSGHSQGAGTTTYLFSHKPDLFKVAIPYNTPGVALGVAKGWTNPVDLLLVQKGSIFFMGGGIADIVSDPASALVYYLSTNNAATKALGILPTAVHEEIVNVPVCDTANCLAGRGYPTAFFMWKLQGASDGPAAFRSGTGEFYRQHPTWGTAMTNVQ